MLFESMGDGLVLIDSRANILKVNPAFVQLLGYKDKNEFLSNIQSPLDLAMNDEKKKMREGIKKTLRNGRDTNEYRGIRKDGSIVPLRIHAASIDSGEEVNIIVNVQDLTSQKEAEAHLKETQRKHEQAQQVAHIGHWELSSPDSAPLWSDEIFRIFGIDPQKGEPSFTKHDTIIHRDEWPLLDQVIHEGFGKGKSFDLTFRILRKNGDTGWLHAIGEPSIDEKGNVVKMFGTAQDITEKKQAEEELREKTERYLLLFNSMRDALLVTDTERKITGCNPAFTALFGYELSELKGRETDLIYHDIEQFKAMGNSLKQNMEKSDFFLTIDYQKKTGEVFPGETNAFYLKDMEGEISGFVGVIRDITERRKAEEELKKHHNRLEELVKERTAELEEKNAFLERMNEAMVGREFRVKELWDENEALRKKLE